MLTNYLPAFSTPPFTCENEGWGEFEMHIDLYYTDKSGKISLPHDLNFQQTRYEEIHLVTFKNPSQSLQQILRETGPLPTDEDRKARKVEGGSKKQKKPFDVEKMADALVKLEEDDLLQVIQLIHDNKNDDTYVQNNVDGESSPTDQCLSDGAVPDQLSLTSMQAGEFSVDLYSLPDNLGKLIWDYLVSLPLVSMECRHGILTRPYSSRTAQSKLSSINSTAACNKSKSESFQNTGVSRVLWETTSHQNVPLWPLIWDAF